MRSLRERPRLVAATILLALALVGCGAGLAALALNDSGEQLLRGRLARADRSEEQADALRRSNREARRLRRELRRRDARIRVLTRMERRIERTLRMTRRALQRERGG